MCNSGCYVCCCDEWSGIGNCDVVILRNMHGVGGCFFLSLLRGGVVNTPFASEFSFEHLFGVSSVPLCSRRSAEISGSCSGDLIQIPFTCVQFIRCLASSSFPIFGKRSGSIVEDSSSCHAGCLVQIPFLFVHFIPAELVSFSSKASCKKGRSPELASTRETPFFSEEVISCFCHIPSFEELSDLL